jgi:hypothetical protein
MLSTLTFAPAGAPLRLSTPRQPTPQTPRSPPTMAASPPATRRAFLTAAALPLAAVLLFPHRAAASLLTRTQAGAEALAARDALGALALLVAERRYQEVRRALRAGALSRVRAACRALADGSVVGGEDAYQKVLKGVEEVDGLALKAGRGDKGAVELLLGRYDQLVETFDEFLDLMPGLAVKPALAK